MCKSTCYFFQIISIVNLNNLEDLRQSELGKEDFDLQSFLKEIRIPESNSDIDDYNLKNPLKSMKRDSSNNIRGNASINSTFLQEVFH